MSMFTACFRLHSVIAGLMSVKQKHNNELVLFWCLTLEATHVTLLAQDQARAEFSFLSLLVYQVSGLSSGRKTQASFLLNSIKAINH